MISGSREAVEMAKQMILEKAGLQSGGSGNQNPRGFLSDFEEALNYIPFLANGSWGGHYQDHGGHRPDQGSFSDKKFQDLNHITLFA